MAAQHFANSFMNNMPAYAIGMGDSYVGPIEDPDRLGIPERTVRGNTELSGRLIAEMLQTVDVAYCEEWQLDHGIMVPLHFLDPNNGQPIIPTNINCQGLPLTSLLRTWGFGGRSDARPTACPSGSRWWRRAAFRIGRRRRTAARSPKRETVNFCGAGSPTIARCCSTCAEAGQGGRRLHQCRGADGARSPSRVQESVLRSPQRAAARLSGRSFRSAAACLSIYMFEAEGWKQNSIHRRLKNI